MAHSLVISHTDADAESALGVCRRLEAFGIQCWVAARDAPLGNTGAPAEAFQDILVLLVVASGPAPSSAQLSDIAAAVQRNVPVIFLRTPSAPPDKLWTAQFPALENAAWLGIEELFEAVTRTLSSVPPPSPSSRESRIGSGAPSESTAYDFGAGGEDYSWASRRAGGARIGAGVPSHPKEIGAGGEDLGSSPLRPRSAYAPNPYYTPSRRYTSAPVPARPRPVSAPAPSPKIDAVSFGVAHPATINAPSSFIIDAWMFQAEARKDAEERALATADGDARFRSQGSAAVPRGAKLRVTVKVGNWPVTPRQQDVWWTGEIANVAFRVTPDGRLPAGAIDGECRISLDGLRIGYVPFQIAVAGTARQSDNLTVGTTVKSAFASYASHDRTQVLARVQGLS